MLGSKNTVTESGSKALKADLVHVDLSTQSTQSTQGDKLAFVQISKTSRYALIDGIEVNQLYTRMVLMF